MSQMDIYVIGLKDRKEQESSVYESSCSVLLATLQNQNAGLSKIFLIIPPIAPVLFCISQLFIT